MEVIGFDGAESGDVVRRSRDAEVPSRDGGAGRWPVSGVWQDRCAIPGAIWHCGAIRCASALSGSPLTGIGRPGTTCAPGHGFGPEDRDPDPARLVAALEELEEARSVWLDYEVQFAQRRKKEKHDGLRRPGTCRRLAPADLGRVRSRLVRQTRGPSPEPLAEVLRRLIAALEREPGAACPVCGGDPPRLAVRPGPRTVVGPVCTDCGIVVPRPVLTPEAAGGVPARGGCMGLASVA